MVPVISLSIISLSIFAMTVSAAVDQIPTLNVEPICKEIASKATPVGDPEICLRQERDARDQLVKEWAQFAPADKSYCLQLSALARDATYTELLTCLEVQRDARNVREENGQRRVPKSNPRPM